MITGFEVSEAAELLLVFLLFMGTVTAVTFIDRWINRER